MERRPDDPETPRLYLTREEFRRLIEEEIVPLFEKLDKHISEVNVGLYALTEMLSARKKLKERKQRRKRED